MSRSGQFVASALASFSLMVSSTGAIASAMPAQAPTTNGWLALSMLTPSGAIALGAAPTAAVCGTAATIAGQPSPGCVLPQVGTMPPPAPEAAPGPPPPAPAEFAGPGFPPLPVILIWLAVLGLDVYLLTRHHHHGVPNSPA